MELDANGLQAAIVAFDLDALDAAYAELDERFADGEAALHASTWEAGQRLLRVLSARDWAQWPSVFSEDFVLQDHRLLGWGTRSRDEFLVQTRAMAELAPDFKLRGDHNLAMSERGMLTVGGWVGSREGGPFEIRMLSVMLVGPDGKIRRLHTYDLDQLDAARACFDELTAEPQAPAARALRERRDAGGGRRCSGPGNRTTGKPSQRSSPPHFRSIDRRPLMRLETDRDDAARGHPALLR